MLVRYKTIFLTILLVLISCGRFRIIKIKGSDTEVNLTVKLAEFYKKTDKESAISVSGGGSGLGITSLINGTTDIANSSRRINEKELEILISKNIQIDSFIFATDAIAIIVSTENQLDSISLETLSLILSGQIDSWQLITKQNMPVTIYGRQSNSGTYDFLKKKLNIQFSQYSKQMSGNAQIIEAIKVDKSGIGYVGAGYVMDKNIKGIKVLKTYAKGSSAVSPLDYTLIIQGKYHFQRPLYQYYRKQDYYKLKDFFEFEKSTEGKQIISKSGYYVR